MCLRAIEEKRFLPVGADRDIASDFQLIAGTNRDLAIAVREGRFRDDLYARLNLWTFQLPSLCDRREDIEPNLDFELRRFSEWEGRSATFNREGRNAYLSFATSKEAVWSANFRDLSASITRMATLAPEGRINEAVVSIETQRLSRQWSAGSAAESDEAALKHLLGVRLEEIDLFDRAQLATVVATCRSSRSVSEAGRTLFAFSRLQKASSNDADRLRKYLTRFGLDFETVTAR